MSKLKPAGAKLTLNDKTYDLLFTVNVIDEIEDALSIDIDELKKAIFKDIKGSKQAQINYKNVSFIIYALIKENCEIRAENGEEIKPLELKQVKRLISNVNIGDCLEAITSAFMCSFLTESEEESPNEKSSQAN